MPILATFIIFPLRSHLIFCSEQMAILLLFLWVKRSFNNDEYNIIERLFIYYFILPLDHSYTGLYQERFSIRHQQHTPSPVSNTAATTTKIDALNSTPPIHMPIRRISYYCRILRRWIQSNYALKYISLHRTTHATSYCRWILCCQCGLCHYFQLSN